MFLNLFTRDEGAVYVLGVATNEEDARRDASEWLDGQIMLDADVRVFTVALMGYDHSQNGIRWIDQQSDPAADARKAQSIRALGAASFDQGFPHTACKLEDANEREEWLRGWFAAERDAS